MPIYQYRCKVCELGFEKLQPMPGEETMPCPECGGEGERIISIVNHTFGFRLSEKSHQRFHEDEFVRDV